MNHTIQTFSVILHLQRWSFFFPHFRWKRMIQPRALLIDLTMQTTDELANHLLLSHSKLSYQNTQKLLYSEIHKEFPSPFFVTILSIDWHGSSYILWLYQNYKVPTNKTAQKLRKLTSSSLLSVPITRRLLNSLSRTARA